jgi:hypothetical protein
MLKSAWIYQSCDKSKYADQLVYGDKDTGPSERIDLISAGVTDRPWLACREAARFASAAGDSGGVHQ